MAQPDKNIFLHLATEANPDPCRHLSIDTIAGDAYESTVHWSSGQTRVGFDTTWESATSFANPADDLKAEVGDYIRLESGTEAGEYKKVTAIETNKRVTLASTWSVNQGAVDWSLVKVLKSRTTEAHVSDLFETLTGEDLDTLDSLLIRMQARLKGSVAGDGSEYTRTQIINHLNGSVVEVTL